MFFKEIVVDGPFGKVKYYAIRVEFQILGSPHIHSFLWVLNAPVLTENNIEEYILFVDAIIRVYVPDNEILKYQVFLFLQKECSRNNRAK